MAENRGPSGLELDGIPGGAGDLTVEAGDPTGRRPARRARVCSCASRVRYGWIIGRSPRRRRVRESISVKP